MGWNAKSHAQRPNETRTPALISCAALTKLSMDL